MGQFFRIIMSIIINNDPMEYQFNKLKLGPTYTLRDLNFDMTLPSLIIICLVHPPLYIYLLLSFSLSNPFKFCCSSKAHQKASHSKRKMMFAFLTRSGGDLGKEKNEL